MKEPKIAFHSCYLGSSKDSSEIINEPQLKNNDENTTNPLKKARGMNTLSGQKKHKKACRLQFKSSIKRTGDSIQSALNVKCMNIKSRSGTACTGFSLNN